MPFLPKKSFDLLSCVSLVGAVLVVAPDANAACPEPDPGVLPYTSPKAPSSACSNADLAFFEAEAQKAGVTFKALEAAVSAKNAACASCIFSSEEDATWAPIVYVGTDGGAFVNFGSCYEKAPGGSAACGAAIARYDLCTSVRCPVDAASCADTTAQNACFQTVVSDPASCGKYDFQTSCPNLAQLDQSCNNAFSVARVLCGVATTPPPKDAGAPGDAGSSDEEEEEEEPETTSSSSSGSSGGKKGSSSSSSSSGVTVTPKQPDTTTTTTSGCAQSSSSSSGSLASLFVVAAAVGAAASRRRSKKPARD